MHGLLNRARLFFRARASDSRIDREFAFHVDMETQHLIREHGLEPGEARRRALVAFGPAESHREELREDRPLSWLSGLGIDLRLGVRMLRKYPGLTSVGVIGMGMAVSIATFMFIMVELAMYPVLPLPDGERIVGIRTWDLRAQQAATATFYDYNAFRESLTSMDVVGAFRMAEVNFILADSTGGEIFLAEMTASAFRAAGVAPLLGRSVVESDERMGSARVVVISHNLWQRRFQADPAILGRVVRLGEVEHTIVGVMPKGFAFPVAQDAWTPLRLNPSNSAPGTGPALVIFGRLAPGMTREVAQSELTAIGRRMAAVWPAVRDKLEPRVVLFPTLVGYNLTSETDDLRILPVLFPLILIVVCVNVATLVYARTASRQTEIAVRASLGASRKRIVGQLFAEGLVLSGAASLVGLAVSRFAFGLVLSKLEATGVQAPFWMRPQLTIGLIGYVSALTVLAAVIIGVMPAWGASRGGVRATLSQLSSGATVRLGRAWTGLIVAQVGVAVAVLPPIVMLSAVYGYYAFRSPGFPTGQYLTAYVEFDNPIAAERTLTQGQRLTRLEHRLEMEPGIGAVTFSSGMPGLESLWRVELDDPVTDTTARRWEYVRQSSVRSDFLEQFGVATRAGRSFSSGDFQDGATAIIVNESFVREILGGRNAIGRHVRRVSEGNNRSVVRHVDPVERSATTVQRSGSAEAPEHGADVPWLEIVGVVADFPPNRTNPETTESRIYEPLRASERHGLLYLSARTTGRPAALSASVQRIALAVDPGLRVNRVLPLDVVYREGARGLARLASLMMGLIAFSVLVLSAAGIYALMSFTVTRRRREIGIRAALGADPRRLLASVFARAVGQLSIGCAVGLVLTFSLDRSGGGELLAGHGAIAIPAVMALMLLSGILAALGPARRGLRVHPADALKSE